MQVEQNIRVGDVLLTVSEFCRQARMLLEQNFPLFWIGGEVSNLSYASSGHIYFNLKDGNAQVRCTMWRNRAQLLAFRLKDGMQIEARALVSLYEARGDLQLNIENIRLKGQGSLYEQFLRLKEKLQQAGLFAPERKRPIPSLPRRVGIVTSLAAAALHDVIATFKRRSPHLEMVIYPAPVQGEQASAKLAQAIIVANSRAQQDNIDVLLLCRGGGSLEDLWAFNEEVLAQAIFASRLPIVSGVGHETDFTLADFVADHRATTPTAAAELLSAAFVQLENQLQHHKQIFKRAMQYRLYQAVQRLDALSLRLIHPRLRIQTTRTQLMHLQQRLRINMQNQFARAHYSLHLRRTRLCNQIPRTDAQSQYLSNRQFSLQRLFDQYLKDKRKRLQNYATSLAHLNPHAVLDRGYAIVTSKEGNIVRDSKQLHKDMTIELRFAAGRAQALVIDSSE